MTEEAKRIKQAKETFSKLNFRKDELELMLARTLVTGGLTDGQIQEIAQDWAYIRERESGKIYQ